MRVLLAVLILMVSFGATVPAKSPFDSVRGLQRPITNPWTEEIEITTVCTVWSTTTGSANRVWVTAAHCVYDHETGKMSTDLTVDNVKVSTVYVNIETDVAILRGGPSAKPFQLSQGEPDRLSPLWSSGYPHGANDQHTVTGTYGGTEDGLALYSLPVMGGMSGAPVVELKSGMVVGMITQRECPVAWCPVARGVFASQLRNVIERY